MSIASIIAEQAKRTAEAKAKELHTNHCKQQMQNFQDLISKAYENPSIILNSPAIIDAIRKENFANIKFQNEHGIDLKSCVPSYVTTENIDRQVLPNNVSKAKFISKFQSYCAGEVKGFYKAIADEINNIFKDPKQLANKHSIAELAYRKEIKSADLEADLGIKFAGCTEETLKMETILKNLGNESANTLENQLEVLSSDHFINGLTNQTDLEFCINSDNLRAAYLSENLFGGLTNEYINSVESSCFHI